MSKFYDKIGFYDETETKPGIWAPGIVERPYTGDILTNYLRNESKDINDTVVLNNKFSIVADKYALEHMDDIRYVHYKTTKWKVTNVEPLSPRLILTVGGVYNEQNEG